MCRLSFLVLMPFLPLVSIIEYIRAFRVTSSLASIFGVPPPGSTPIFGQSETVPPCSGAENRSDRHGLSILGVRVSLNQPPVPVEVLDSTETLRVVKVRFLNLKGASTQLSPVATLKCGQMLNRLLGIMFRSTSIELPGEIRHLFRFGESRIQAIWDFLFGISY